MILTHLQVCQCRLNYCNFRCFQQEVFVPLSCSLSLHLPKEVLSLQLFGGLFRSAIQRRCFRRGTFVPGSIVSSTPLASQRWDCFHRNQCIHPMRPIRKGRKKPLTEKNRGDRRTRLYCEGLRVRTME